MKASKTDMKNTNANTGNKNEKTFKLENSKKELGSHESKKEGVNINENGKLKTDFTDNQNENHQNKLEHKLNKNDNKLDSNLLKEKSLNKVGDPSNIYISNNSDSIQKSGSNKNVTSNRSNSSHRRNVRL